MHCLYGGYNLHRFSDALGLVPHYLLLPGATVHHAWGEVTAVNFKAGTWMVEYGRGFIPSTLGFALADTIFSTQDFVTMMKIFYVYSKALLLEVSTFVIELNESYF